MEQVIGGAIARDKKSIQLGFAQYRGMIHSFRDNQTITTTSNTNLNLVATDSNGQTNILLNAFQNNFTLNFHFKFPLNYTYHSLPIFQ